MPPNTNRSPTMQHNSSFAAFSLRVGGSGRPWSQSCPCYWSMMPGEAGRVSKTCQGGWDMALPGSPRYPLSFPEAQSFSPGPGRPFVCLTPAPRPAAGPHRGPHALTTSVRQRDPPVGRHVSPQHATRAALTAAAARRPRGPGHRDPGRGPPPSRRPPRGPARPRLRRSPPTGREVAPPEVAAVARGPAGTWRSTARPPQSWRGWSAATAGLRPWCTTAASRCGAGGGPGGG